jgi:hypothetical protein
MQCNPDGLTGIELFEHQVRFYQRAYSKKEGKHKIRYHLAISPSYKPSKIAHEFRLPLEDSGRVDGR